MSHPNDPNEPQQHEPEQPGTRPFEQDAPTEYFTPAQGAPSTPPPMTPPPPVAPRPGWFTGARRTAALTGVTGLVLGGLIGGGIAWAATDNSGTPTVAASSSTPQSGTTEHHGTGAGAKERKRGMVGAITAITGDSWAIQSRTGQSVTVTVDEQTKFGTAKKPEQKSDFAVGDTIAVVGKRDASDLVATRIVKRRHTSASTTPSTQPS